MDMTMGGCQVQGRPLIVVCLVWQHAIQDEQLQVICIPFHSCLGQCPCMQSIRKLCGMGAQSLCWQQVMRAPTTENAAQQGSGRLISVCLTWQHATQNEQPQVVCIPLHSCLGQSPCTMRHMRNSKVLKKSSLPNHKSFQSIDVQASPKY